jgi:hypothetical protein
LRRRCDEYEADETQKPDPAVDVPVCPAGRGYLAWAEPRRHARKADRPALTNLAQEVEAAQRARIAAMTGVQVAAEARGDDGIVAAEKFLHETWEAYCEELKGIYAKHGRRPPAWLRDPKSLIEW